jgi:acylphosphatase
MNENSERSKEQKAVHVIVDGRVQGVGFRHFTRNNAQRLGVRGWVRNREDGTVEIQAEGAEYRLKQFLKKIREGPTHSWVQNVDVEWQATKGESHGFRVRY